MTYPVVARPKLCLIHAKAGRMYFWCLRATSADGIDGVGVICPSDNPSSNYHD